MWSWRIAAGTAPHGKAFVDLQNDVTTRDLQIATREGFRSIEHVKRYTTAGMATDQGKTSIPALMTVAGMLGQPVHRAHDVSHAVHARDVHTLAGAARGDLLEPVPQTLRSTRGPRRMARCSKMSAPGSARAAFPRNGEDEPRRGT